MYKSDTALSDLVSGLSIGIDSMLESFQADFIGHLQNDISSTVETDEVSLSLIEKNQIQILIAASKSYRIFMFLKTKPPEFLREILRNFTSEIQEKVDL